MSKLEALKKAFATKVGGGDNNASWKEFYQFWRMADDTTAIVRFLPDLEEENPLGFLVENLIHELNINGEKKRVPCLSMYGEQCPICELSRKYYDEKNETLGKRYYRKKSLIGQVIVIESPIEHDQAKLVKLIDFGPKIFKLIQAAFQSGDLEQEPYALKGGYNFRIKKTKAGQHSDYSTSSFAPKQTDIDDDVIEQLDLRNLKEFRQKYISRAEIEAFLLADQTGTSSSTSTITATMQSTASEQQQEVVVKTLSKPVAEDATASVVASNSSTNSVLEQLRARAKAKSTAE